MYDTAIDLLEACCNRTLYERFRFSLADNVAFSQHNCSADVEPGELVYLDDEGLIRPVREMEVNSYVALCVDRRGNTATVTSQHNVQVVLPYEGPEPEVGEMVFAAGSLVKGTVSVETPVVGPLVQIGPVTETHENGYVTVRFQPQMLS